MYSDSKIDTSAGKAADEQPTIRVMSAQSKQGIWPPGRAFYVQAMLFNARSAQASVNRVAEILEGINSGAYGASGGEELMDEVLNNLQNIVVNGAALSRYLWPADKRRETRGAELRAMFAISEGSVLKSRALRNDIEHMDERLDDYLAGSLVGIVLPQFVGRAPKGKGDGVPRHLFRAYFVDTGIFELLGQRYEIQPIADEISALGRKLEHR